MESNLPDRLFRFFSVPERDIPTLADGHVYYPSPRQLNDPFDCQLCFDTRLNQLSDVEPNELVLGLMSLAKDQTGIGLSFSTDEDLPFQQRFDYLCEDFLTCMFKYGVHSLTENCDHPLMWSHYGAAFRGFVVCYDTTSPVADGVRETTLRVTYDNFIPKLKLGDLFASDDAFKALRTKLLTTKGPTWAYENEWRVVIWPGERIERIPYKIVGVTFGHMMGESHRERLRDQFGTNVEYKIAAPDEQSFSVSMSGRPRVNGLARPHSARSTYFYNRRYAR